mgnify:CR=1 FL=1
MRGIPSLITDIRKKVFTEVARMAYDGGDYTKAEDLPYIIVPGDQPLHRESIFLERAIAGERVRLAMGLGIRPVQYSLIPVFILSFLYSALDIVSNKLCLLYRCLKLKISYRIQTWSGLG